MKLTILMLAALSYSNLAHAKVELKTRTLINGTAIIIKSDDRDECLEAIIDFVKTHKSNVVAADSSCISSARASMAIGMKSNSSAEERKQVEQQRVETEKKLEAEWKATLPFRASILIE